jgi:putative SOS response-associated peptidase YedK
MYYRQKAAEARRAAEGVTTRATPYPPEELTCWPVSPRVGNVKNNDPSLIDPIAA